MGYVTATEIKAEPNLVPLLDLTFQLIMFFMICVNFVSEQVNEDIHLPVAQSARAMDKGEVDVLFLNLDAQGRLLVPGKERPMTTLYDKAYFLRQQFTDAKHLAEERGDSTGRVNTAVIIRGDKGATYGQMYELLKLCKDAGYRKLQLRAYTQAGG